MTDYRLHEEKIDVPKGAGRRGFLHTIDQILQLDRVQGINIDARGNVTYTRYVRDDSSEPDIGPKISFESLMPYASIRNGAMAELPPVSVPSRAIAKLFQRVANERLHPIAFVTGANPTLWEWLQEAEGIETENREEFYGLPVLADRHLDDYVLILAAAFGRSAGIADVQKSFKIIMPQRRDDAFDRNSSGEGGNPAGGDVGRVQAVGTSGRGALVTASPQPGRSGAGNRGGTSG